MGMSAFGLTSVEIPMAMLKGDMKFLSFTRSEQNFQLLDGERPRIPPLCHQGHPMRMLQDDTCMQPWSMMTTFFTFFCYHGMMTVMRTLQLSPYSPHGDCFNIDWLLCDVEQCIFFYLRSAYSKSIAATESAPPPVDDEAEKPYIRSVACLPEGCDREVTACRL